MNLLAEAAYASPREVGQFRQVAICVYRGLVHLQQHREQVRVSVASNAENWRSARARRHTLLKACELATPARCSLRRVAPCCVRVQDAQRV